MFDLFHRAKISDFEESNWSEFDESEKLSNLRDYHFVLRPVSVNYRRCLREFLANADQLLDAELLDSFPNGIFKTQEIHDYLIKTICSSSASDRDKIFSHVLISDELKQELKTRIAVNSTSCKPTETIIKDTDDTVRNVPVEANDEDFEIDNWEKFGYREKRCKLMIQGRRVQLMLNNYKRCLLEYLDNSTTCHELIESLPDNMLSLPEFHDSLKNFINHASDKERILLLYRLVSLKYGDQTGSRVKNYDLITIFNPKNHKGETVEFWPVYLFLKCGLERDGEQKKEYFRQAHHSFKKVGETALESWRGTSERSTEALGLLIPCCKKTEDSRDESFQKFCDARLYISGDDKKYGCKSLAGAKTVFCYNYRTPRKVLEFFSKEDSCAHARSLLHNKFYEKYHENEDGAFPENWTLFEFMDILKVPFYAIEKSTGEKPEHYVNKLASELNWLYKIRNRLKCRFCGEQMRFDFEFSKKGEDVEKSADTNARSLFAAYMTTHAHCIHQEEPHDIDVYFDHCIECHGIIDSRYCTIFDGKYYLCRRCGSGHPSNTVPGSICPYCGSNKMKFVGYTNFKCQNCGKTVKVSSITFKNRYNGINIGELASSKARSNGVFTYRKNCEDRYTINCETGIPKSDIVEDPVEEVESSAVTFGDVPFDEDMLF
jgi:3-phenylpropionate/cinnamic acid dioxygenase small subunit